MQSPHPLWLHGSSAKLRETPEHFSAIRVISASTVRSSRTRTSNAADGSRVAHFSTYTAALALGLDCRQRAHQRYTTCSAFIALAVYASDRKDGRGVKVPTGAALETLVADSRHGNVTRQPNFLRRSGNESWFVSVVRTMEYLLERLPTKPHSAALRIAITTGLVAVSFVLLVGLQQRAGVLGMFVLLPAIAFVAVLFDRTAGIYATVLSTAILYVILTPQGDVLLPRPLILPLLLFLFVGLAFVICGDGMRSAWQRAAAAERDKDLLLQELGHRMKNNFTIVISMLTMQARLKSNEETRAALEKAAARIQAIAAAHEHLRSIDTDGRVHMRSYLEQLCSRLGDVLRDIRPIAVRVDADDVELSAEQAVLAGLIVNELVTNAMKHAFPGDRAGAVEVILRKAAADSTLILVVKDDGVGCPADRPEGIGSRLLRLLAQQLRASMTWEMHEPGCQVQITFSATYKPVDHSLVVAKAAPEGGPLCA